MGSIASDYYCEGVSAWGHHAIMVDGISLQIIDVTNVTNPVQVGYYNSRPMPMTCMSLEHPRADGQHYYPHSLMVASGIRYRCDQPGQTRCRSAIGTLKSERARNGWR